MSMMPTGPDDRGYEPAGYPVPGPEQPPRPSRPNARVGRASSVEVRQESQYASNNATLALTVLAFRLLEPGNPRPLDVLMRGRALSGTVRDGDWVELTGPPNDAGRWNVASVQNLTTGATVVVTGARGSTAGRVVAIVALVLVTLVGLLVVIGVVATFATS